MGRKTKRLFTWHEAVDIVKPYVFKIMTPMVPELAFYVPITMIKQSVR